MNTRYRKTDTSAIQGNENELRPWLKKINEKMINNVRAFETHNYFFI
jgi:IS1 family transposase